jgi:multidrug resistance protein
VQPLQDRSGTASKGSRSPLLFIFLTVFIDLLGFGIVLPLLPVYTKMYGADELTLGLLFSCFSGMQFLFAPVWGRLSDRIGRRPVLIGGLIGTAGSYVLFAVANDLRLLFVSRLLAGFFGANISTAQAYIADVTTPENRARGMGLIGAAFGLGFTLGPLIGGELTALSPAAPGYFAAALSLASATFGFLKLPEPPRGVRRDSRLFGTEEVRHALRDGRIGILLLLSYLAIFAFSSFEAMFTRFGLALFPSVFHLPRAVDAASFDELLAAAPVAGRYLAVIGVISAVIQGGLIRRLVPRYGETALAVVGPVFLAASMLVVAVAGGMASWGLVIAGCALLPIGFGLNNPSLNGLISRASPAEHQGAYLGLNQSIASLARLSGPPVAGGLFKALGPTSPFFAAAGILAVATVIASMYRAKYGASFAARESPTA